MVPLKYKDSSLKDKISLFFVPMRLVSKHEIQTKISNVSVDFVCGISQKFKGL